MSQQTIKKYFEDEWTSTISSILNNKVLSVKYTNSNSSVVRKWIKEGLIDDFRENKLAHNHQSIIDVIWIGIIERLRDFGLSRAKIKKVKEQLLVRSDDIATQYPYLEFYVIRACLIKHPYYLAVDHLDKVKILSLKKLNDTLKANPTDYIVINLNTIFLELIEKTNATEWSFTNLFEFSLEEMELMAFIQSNDFEKVSIKMLDGGSHLIEGKERLHAKTFIGKVIKENAYQHIELETEKGRVVHIKRKVKKKVNKD